MSTRASTVELAGLVSEIGIVRARLDQAMARGRLTDPGRAELRSARDQLDRSRDAVNAEIGRRYLAGERALP